MSKIQELLKNRTDIIDLDYVEQNYPWLYEKNINCIISPDSDGFMCALLMSHYLDWNIKGFYDGKVMLYSSDVKPRDCVFLDMEIFNKNIRSVGQHCIIPYNKIYTELSLDGFDSCLSPGCLRGYDAHDGNFRLKFPLATIHFLISVLHRRFPIKINKTAISSLLFVDGCFNVIFSYPENCLNWFKYLKIDEHDNPLNTFFFKGDLPLGDVMKMMDNYFKIRDSFGNKEVGRGDHLVISDRNGELLNCTQDNGLYKINENNKNSIKQFIQMNAENFGWLFKDNWSWENLKFEKLQKKILGGEGNKKTFCQRNVREVYTENLVSNAVTASNRMEYSTTTNENLFS